MNRETSLETCPFLVVDEVSFELERISDLCYALGCVNERDGVVSVDVLAHSFMVVRDLVDTQIKSLSRIDWHGKGGKQHE